MGGTTKSREVHLARRPTGMPVPEDFAVTEVDVAEPAPGEVLVRNRFVSVDPYMRGRMDDRPSYVPPFVLGAVMTGGAIGEVLVSHAPELSPGDIVVHDLGWREVAVADAHRFARLDPGELPLSLYLGILGMTGLTAYVGLTEIASVVPGEVVFVSGAAGAVGSAAVQLARLLGASRVVGSAGSSAKVERLVEDLGADAAFDYHEGDLDGQLAAAAPEGIDVYFDNVGGAHLEAALGAMHLFGRVAACGAISRYNATDTQAGPRNLFLVVGKRLTIRGFIVGDYAAQRADYLERACGWIADGRLRALETVVEGIESAPAAFVGMMRGDNVGKMVVRLG